jgi:hypothetical protein
LETQLSAAAKTSAARQVQPDSTGIQSGLCCGGIISPLKIALSWAMARSIIHNQYCLTEYLVLQHTYLAAVPACLG